MPTLFCLVRHGATDWNHDGRAQGISDVPLNVEGLKQAELVARRLAVEPWNAIYSSHLQRAMKTAEAIARATGLTVQPEPRLQERNVGIIEGTTARERAIRWGSNKWQVLPGAELPAETRDRITGLLAELAGRHPNQQVLCVTHGGVIFELLESLGQGAVREGVRRNTSVTCFEWADGQIRLVSPPDFRHILEDGIEYCADKRVLATALSHLQETPVPFQAIDNATAVESALEGDRVVAFLRALTDEVYHGCIDLTAALPGYEPLLQRLHSRLQARYPDVHFVQVEGPTVKLD